MFTLVRIVVDFCCGDLIHTLSTRGRRRVTQRFPTRIIRDSPALFAFVTLSCILFVIPLHHFCWMCVLQDGNFFSQKQKVVQFSQCDRGGNRSTHYPGNWIVSVRVRTEHPVQPLLYLSIPNVINYHQQTLQYQQLVDSTMVLSTVG